MRRSFSLAVTLSSVSALAVMALACTNRADDCAKNGTCAAAGGASGASGDSGLGGTSGTSGTGGSGGDGGTCDTSKDPSEESCLVDEQYAVFVSPSGNDTTDGSRGTPFGTIEKAMETAKTNGLIVIACNDTFAAPVNLTSAHEGVIVHGGFKCTNWSYDPGKKTPVTPTAAGFALTIDGVSKATGFKDFAFTAKEGAAPGESSIAAFVKNSANVRFTRVDFTAGKGADGKAGVLVPVTHETSQAKLNGNDASGDSGGKVQLCTCAAGGQSVGGKGGDGGLSAGGGSPGQPLIGAANDGKFGQACAGTGTGGDGANASHEGAAAGAATVGTLAADGFKGTVGTDGKNGTPGQGGGGGTGTAAAGSAGGGGGCGGCGGAGGPGGGAGGSSIALMVFDSTLDTQDCTFTASDAGKGGDGAKGQNGATQVGAPGKGGSFGCNGGAGGKGGNGGAGGGAAGGISVGVLQSTAAAVTNTTPTFAKGKGGAKGIGGVPGSNDGVAGDGQDTLTL